MATPRQRRKKTDPPEPRRGEDDVGKAVCQRHEQLYSIRGQFNVLWQTVAQRMRPNQADFTMKWAEGQRRTNLVFDDTAPQACENGVAALESLLCPASRQWHGLKARDKDLQGKLVVRQWLEDVTDCLFAARYAPEANFQSQVHETLGDILSFGNGPFLVDDIVGIGIRYRSLPLAYTFGMENAAGMIDIIHREWSMTPSATMDAYRKGIIDFVPDHIADEFAQRQNSEKTWDFIHAVCPTSGEEYADTKKPYTSTIVCKNTQQTLKRSGYYTQPILMPRYRVNSRETYGRGPGVDLLPTILQLNEMAKANTRVTQRISDPPYLTVDDTNLPAFNLRSNSINAGYLSPDGKELIRPLPGVAKINELRELMQDLQTIVRRGFLNDIISILSEHPDMTATQVLQLAQERGYLVAPIIGRIQNELMGPVITREIDILHRAGQLPDPPAILRGRRFDYDVEYTSFSQTAQKQSKALAISMTLQQATPLFQAQPDLMTRMLNLPRTFEELAGANDAPARILNTDQEQQDMEQAAVGQQQLTNLAQIAGPASQAIKNLSDASKGQQAITPGGGAL